MTPTEHPGRLVRVEPVDMLELNDGILLLYERTVLRLSDLGRAIVDLCEQPRSEAEIARHLAATFGTPPDGDLQGATTTALEGLLTDGILRRDPATQPPC